MTLNEYSSKKFSQVRNFETAILCFGDKLRKVLVKLSSNVKSEVTEIRIRVNKNIVINIGSISYYLQLDGSISRRESDLYVSQRDIEEVFQIICNHSVYSFQNQIKNGFVTFRGGHRIGLCGTAVVEDGNIVNIKDISSINVRIAREIFGCSDEVVKIFNSIPGGLLIVGPPSSGKTTLLRDMSRVLSKNLDCVAIIDERGEIAGMCDGIAQFDIGNCDILNEFPKHLGISHAVRVLSPKIVICDEIGSNDDILSIESALNCGVFMVCSIHARDVKEFIKKPQAEKLILTGAFQSFIFLDSNNRCKIREFFNLERISFMMCQN